MELVPDRQFRQSRLPEFQDERQKTTHYHLTLALAARLSRGRLHAFVRRNLRIALVLWHAFKDCCEIYWAS